MMLENAVQFALTEMLLALADDELILGHRNSEWTGHAPILEEDIAFANLALDELGHAATWYGLLAQVVDADPQTYPDRLVFQREAAGFRCMQMVELPRGDWAFSMLRQYLFDAAESVRLESYSRSQYQPLADVSARMRKEEIYHLRHSGAWVRRLGLGTAESRRRLQTALDQLWPYAGQLFTPLPGEVALVAAGFILPARRLSGQWQAMVIPWLQDSGLSLPLRFSYGSDRRQHTPHLAPLITDMQSVARLESDGKW